MEQIPQWLIVFGGIAICVAMGVLAGLWVGVILAGTMAILLGFFLAGF